MDFVILANAWQDGQRNPTSKHHIAEELARKGHRVLWIDGSGMRTPRVTAGVDRKRIFTKLKGAFKGVRPGGENLWVISPVIMPLPHSAFFRGVNAWIYLVSSSMARRSLGFRHPTLISFLPIVPLMLKRWRFRRIYYCVDRWDAFDTYDAKMMLRLDSECCRIADCVIASSRDLLERVSAHNSNSHLVLHGVNFEHFARALDGPPLPHDMPDYDNYVGFMGLISEWVDQDLLVDLARSCRQTGIVLIGKAHVDVSRLAAEPNIWLLGPRPFATLPEYVASFDVGIIPFVVNELTRAVNPIKLREMLAAGCPVVSTWLPEVSGYEPDAVLADSNEDFIAKVKEKLSKPPDSNSRQAINRRVVDESWEAKVDRILTLVSADA